MCDDSQPCRQLVELELELDDLLVGPLCLTPSARWVVNRLNFLSYSFVWTIGVAVADITPTEPQWMAGYASRTMPAESALHRLQLKVKLLVLNVERANDDSWNSFLGAGVGRCSGSKVSDYVI